MSLYFTVVSLGLLLRGRMPDRQRHCRLRKRRRALPELWRCRGLRERRLRQLHRGVLCDGVLHGTELRSTNGLGLRGERVGVCAVRPAEGRQLFSHRSLRVRFGTAVPRRPGLCRRIVWLRPIFVPQRMLPERRLHGSVGERLRELWGCVSGLRRALRRLPRWQLRLRHRESVCAGATVFRRAMRLRRSLVSERLLLRFAVRGAIARDLWHGGQHVCGLRSVRK
jgi:hypothetical protein